MALVPLRTLLDHAAEHDYGVAAFNVNNMEQIQAIMEAAQETDSPVIVQASRGARAYSQDAYLRHLMLAAVELYPQIPIILATGRGSEADAVRALKAGAASYVPKDDLTDTLMDTIDQVLQLADKDKSQDRLMQCLTNTRYQFKLPSDPSLIQPLINIVTNLMEQLNMGDVATRRHVAVALEEALRLDHERDVCIIAFARVLRDQSR